MLHEKTLWEKGFRLIACCDEAGRGCLFGPVVAAAVILRPYDHIEGVKDSKKLSEQKRDHFFRLIRERSVAIGIGVVSVEEIEEINIKQASRKAMVKAVNHLRDASGKPVKPEVLLVDAETLDISYPQQAIIHGEDQVHGIAAASIVAKVTRDRMCLEWHQLYPEYGLDQHKGYGTRAHQEAIRSHGPTPMHRKHFIRKILAQAGQPL